jgi:hypothetical protein
VTHHTRLLRVEKNDLDLGYVLLLFLALPGGFDLGPQHAVGFDEFGDLQVASIGGIGALGLELRRFHAGGHGNRVIGAGQLDPGELGVDLLGRSGQREFVERKDHQLGRLRRWQRWR